LPSATSRVRALLVNWWEDLHDRNEVTRGALEAVLLCLILTIAGMVRRATRLIAAPDRAATRICGLVLALAVVYGLATLIYALTRIVLAWDVRPFVFQTLVC
jgi:hypothetical protein